MVPLNNKEFKTPFNLPKLPPKIQYDELVEHVARAHASLARLDEMLKQTQRTGMGQLIENTFMTRESVLSSKIEGTQVTLEDVLIKDAEGDQEINEDNEKNRDIREVRNYRRALHEGARMIDQGNVLAENNVKRLHHVLLQSW